MARARDILLRLTGDPSDAQRALKDVRGDLNSFDRIQAEARADIEIAGAKAKLERLQTQLSRLSRQEATPAVQIKAASTVRAIERIEADLKRLDGKRASVTIDVEDNRPPGGGGTGRGAAAGGAAGAVAGRAGAGAAAGVLAGVVALKESATAAIEAEKSAARLQTQLKALGISYDENAKKIDTQIQKVSNLSGLDDEDLADSFTSIVRVTGDVEKSLNLVGLAADFARAKNIDVAKAGDIVSRVAGGNIGVLSRYGISIEKGATATEALGVLQEKFAGQAEAYGDTTAGALDRAGVASENAAESIGDVLRPALAAAADAFVDFVEFVRDNFPKVKDVVASVVDAVKGFLEDNRDDIDSTKRAFENVGEVVRFVWEEVILPVIRDAVDTIGGVMRGFVRAVRGAVRIITGILTGDLGKAWDGVKDVFQGGIDAVKSILDGATKPLRRAGRAIGSAVKGGIRAGFEGVKSIGTTVVNALIDVVNAGIDTVNKVLRPRDLGPFGKTPDLRIGKIDPIGEKGPGGQPQRRPGAPARTPGGFRLPASVTASAALAAPTSLAGSFSGSGGITIENVNLPPAPAAAVPDARHQASQLVGYLERMGR